LNISQSNPVLNSKKLYYFLLSAWFLLNLFQDFFTELTQDEAYYFIYAQNLAWGYYDHPPIIALLIKLGYMIFPNELGVRFFISLLSVGTIMLLVKLSGVRNYLLFFTFLFSIFIFQIFGSIAIPDSPMIFFTVLFFYYYRKYLEEDNWLDVLMLSLSVALLLYSKYLGVFIVFFTFLSNLKLVKRKTFWATFLLSAILMLPHLVWQINHDFVTIYFHLIERSRDSVFSGLNILNYVLGQVAILNPFIAIAIVYFAFINQTRHDFSKALRYNIVGIYAVGLILSLFGNVEANWTDEVIIPLVILSYPVIEERLNFHKTLYLIGVFSFGLILFVRAYLIREIIPLKKILVVQNEFYGWEKWASKIRDITNDHPVIFVNSYQKASKYSFYSGKESFSFNYLLYRKNQFDLMNIEEGLNGQTVFLFKEDKNIYVSGLKTYPIPEPDSVKINDKYWYYKKINNYHSYNFIPVEIHLKKKEFKAGTLIGIPVRLINPLDTTLIINPQNGSTFVAVAFLKKGKVVKYKETEDLSGLSLGQSYNTTLLTYTPDEPGEYELYVSIRTGWLPPGINSRMKKITVTVK